MSSRGWPCSPRSVAAGLLVLSALATDDSRPRIETLRTIAELGSIRAVEHRDELALHPDAASQTIADQGSIRAVEHRDELALHPDAASQTIADQGSIRAVEHRDEVTAPNG